MSLPLIVLSGRSQIWFESIHVTSSESLDQCWYTWLLIPELQNFYNKNTFFRENEQGNAKVIVSSQTALGKLPALNTALSPSQTWGIRPEPKGERVSPMSLQGCFKLWEVPSLELQSFKFHVTCFPKVFLLDGKIACQENVKILSRLIMQFLSINDIPPVPSETHPCTNGMWQVHHQQSLLRLSSQKWVPAAGRHWQSLWGEACNGVSTEWWVTTQVCRRVDLYWWVTKR